MQRLIKAKRIRIAAILISVIIGIASLFGTAYFALKLSYVPLGICLALAAFAIYALPFLWISLKDHRLYAKLVSEAEKGITAEDALSETLGIKPEAVRKIIGKCVKKEYVSADKFTA